jgi:hypothetical protein
VLVIGFESIDGADTYRVTMDFPIVDLKPLPVNQFPLTDIAAALGIPRAGITDALVARNDLLVHVDSTSFAALDPDFVLLGKFDRRFAFSLCIVKCSTLL